jgi:hypothetical protein
VPEQSETAKNEAIYTLAEDIREVDGDHSLGAAELAEKLVERDWIKYSPKDDVSVDYPRLEGDTIVLGPGIFASTDESVINWRGVNYIPQEAESPHPPLKSYKDGEQVEAFKNGSWLPGHITSRDKVSGHLHIHTERGPVTIATSNGVRKLS